MLLPTIASMHLRTLRVCSTAKWRGNVVRSFVPHVTCQSCGLLVSEMPTVICASSPAFILGTQAGVTRSYTSLPSLHACPADGDGGWPSSKQQAVPMIELVACIVLLTGPDQNVGSEMKLVVSDRIIKKSKLIVHAFFATWSYMS
jgi:hypothetical protein